MYQAMILPFSFLTMLLLVMLGTDYSWFCSYFYLIDLICNLIYKWFILYCMYLFISHLLLFFRFFFLKGLRLIYQSKIQCMCNFKTDILTNSIAENGNVRLFWQIMI